MSSLRALRTALSSLAVGVLVATAATATAGTASAAPYYSFTLCNYADDFHVSAYFPARNHHSATAWTNQCVVTTHVGGEQVGITIRPDTPQNKALATRYYTTDRSNDVFHTSGSYYSPVIRPHAHR